MRRHADKRDENEDEIVGALERAGATVERLVPRRGGGLNDLLVGVAGRNYLLEVKTRNGKLSKTQINFRQWWRGQYAVVRTPEDALRCVGLLR